MTLSVMIGLPSYRPVDPRVDMARMHLARKFAEEGIAWGAFTISQEPWLAKAMNTILMQFLKSDCERLLILDDDVMFNAADVIKLVRSDKDVIGGDYALKSRGAGMVCWRQPNGRVEGDLVECLFLGLGFSSYSRKAIEDVVRASEGLAYQCGPRDPNAGQIGHSVFHPMHVNGLRHDDDVVFFKRLVDCGYTPWLDTSIRLGHIGTHVYLPEDAA